MIIIIIHWLLIIDTSQYNDSTNNEYNYYSTIHFRQFKISMLFPNSLKSTWTTCSLVNSCSQHMFIRNDMKLTSRPFRLVGVGGDAVASEGSLGQGLLGDVPWNPWRGDGFVRTHGNLKHQTLGEKRIKERMKNVEFHVFLIVGLWHGYLMMRILI